jgi:hypothetical protein
MDKFSLIRLYDIRSNLALLNGNSDFKFYENFLDKTISLVDEIIKKETKEETALIIPIDEVK